MTIILQEKEIKKKLVSSKNNFTELGSLISGKSNGRQSKSEITVCDLTGTGVQDTAIARYAFEKAINNEFGLKLK